MSTLKRVFGFDQLRPGQEQVVSAVLAGRSAAAIFPTGSGNLLNLKEVAGELTRRLAGLFLPDGAGQRPFATHIPPFQHDPHWRDLLLFHEYFHGDSGAGLGASHQTGWTGLVATLLQRPS